MSAWRISVIGEKRKGLRPYVVVREVFSAVAELSFTCVLSYSFSVPSSWRTVVRGVVGMCSSFHFFDIIIISKKLRDYTLVSSAMPCPVEVLDV